MSFAAPSFILYGSNRRPPDSWFRCGKYFGISLAGHMWELMDMCKKAKIPRKAKIWMEQKVYFNEIRPECERWASLGEIELPQEEVDRHREIELEILELRKKVVKLIRRYKGDA